jgi:transcriptional regulator with XRE-family HTH domain
MNSEKSLGEVIRKARVPKGSLRSFASILNVAPSYMSDIENDRRTPSEHVLKNIASLLGLDFDDLMARAGRFGDDAGRYFRRHPAAGLLLTPALMDAIFEAGCDDAMVSIRDGKLRLAFTRSAPTSEDAIESAVVSLMFAGLEGKWTAIIDVP